MCEEGLHDPFTDQVACARYRAERDMLAQAMERVADDIERTFLGFEGAEDAPAMRWARQFRAALGSLHAPVRDMTMSAYDLLPEDERDAIAWVRDHGGLDAVKKLLDWVVGHCSTKQQLDFDFWLSGRVMHELGFDEDMADRDEVERRLLARLMPEGMEWLVEVWPRFEDHAPLKLGDTALIDGEADMVEAVQLWIHGKPVIYGDGGSQQLDKGERVKRPVADTWERLEEDAGKDPCGYFGFDGEEICGKCPASGKNCEQTMARDLVRRCRALAERERSE